MPEETLEESKQALDVIQIERLAVKVKGLVDLLERTRGDLETARQESTDLRTERDELRAKLDGAAAERQTEVDRLLEERDQIRERVQRMLGQIETLGASLEDEAALNDA